MMVGTEQTADDNIVELTAAHAGTTLATPRHETEAHFPPDAEAPGAARRLVTEILSSWGQGSAVIQDAQLVLSELATNAVVHARTKFTVGVRTDERGLRISVSDASPAQPMVRALPAESEPMATFGRGLHLVAMLSNGSWGIERTPGGKSVWAELQA